MAKRIMVHVSDAKVSQCETDVIATFALGSCIAVALYDPAVHVGGVLHFQLPNSKIDPDRAKVKPFIYADTGMHVLFGKMFSMGAVKSRMIVKIAGGAAMETSPKGFNIGKRNHLAIRKILWRYGLLLESEDVGGHSPRNLYLRIEDGQVSVSCGGKEKHL